MTIRGSLKTMSVPELLQWISQGRKSGLLEIHAREGEARIAFEGGELIYSSSDSLDNTLGRWLIRNGYVDEEKYQEARRLRGESNIGVAKILTDLNYVREQDVIQTMRRKVEEEIYGIFLAENGEFVFLDEELPELELLPIRIDITKTVLRITQRLDEKEDYDFDSSGTHVPIKQAS